MRRARVREVALKFGGQIMLALGTTSPRSSQVLSGVGCQNLGLGARIEYMSYLYFCFSS